MAEGGRGGQNPNQNKSPRHSIIRVFFLAMSREYDLEEQQKHAFRRFLLKQLGNFGLNWNAQDAFENWIKTNSPDTDFDFLTNDNLTTIVDICYEHFCNKYGPVKADHILSTASSACESRPESKHFSIRQVL